MRSKSGCRFFYALFLSTLVLSVSACWVFQTRKTCNPTDEAEITAVLEKLVPDGRIFSNDLSAVDPVCMRGAYLFDREIVVEDVEGNLTSLDRMSLAPIWMFTGIPGTSEFDLVTSPLSVFVISEGVLYEIDRKYGTQRSANELDFVPSAAPAATDSTAYVPSLAAAAGHRTLITINLADGIPGWGQSTRSSITTAPVRGGSLARPVIYFVTDSGGVFAMPAEAAHKGPPEPSWTHGADGRVVAGLVLDSDLGDQLLLIGSEKGELWALDRITGTTAWVHYSGEPITRAAWAAGDQVYFANTGGFHALDRSNGKEIWAVSVLDLGDGDLVNEPLTFLVRRENAVYVHDDEGRVFALSPSTGEMLRWAQFDKDVLFLSNGDSNVMYLVTASGFVFAIDKTID